jgi:hypothetical protein
MAEQDKGRGANPGTGSRSPGASPGREAMHEARQQAEKLSDRAMEQGRSMFDSQKDNAARQVDSVAHAFRSTAGQLSGQGQSQAGQYVGMAADRLESLGRQLRQKDLDTMVNDVQDLGRRAPGAFFAGSVVAGFLLARFMKSSADRHRGSMHSSRSDWRRDAMHDNDRTGPMSGPHGTGSHDELHPAGGNPGSHTPAGTSPMAGSAGTGSVAPGGLSGTSSTGSTGGTTGTPGPSTTPGSGGSMTGGIHGTR